MTSGSELRKVIVVLFAFKKHKKKALTLLISKISEDLTIMSTHHLLAILVDLSPYGMALSSL
jgi:hypothetical protein